jgi:hypothetical protein
MPARKRILCLGLLIFCSLQTPAALEITRDNLKLELHEGIGRFSLYSRPDASSSVYTPLFVAQDPRTSVMSMIVEDRLYKLGESSAFRETLQKTQEGARFSWVSDDLKVTEDFIFVPRGVAIRISLNNQSNRELLIGMRLCFDTYLGEKSSSHFSTSRHPEVSRELEIPGDTMVSYWKSASRDKGTSYSLYSHTSGDSVTVPDRIIFANWKRISDTTWNFVSSPTRNFTLVPYSINDSAVCQYYSPRRIQSGKGYTINLLFTTEEVVPALPAATAGRVPDAEAGTPPSQQMSQIPAPLAESFTPTLYKDLLAVNTLIEEINRLITEEAVSPQELQRLHDTLAALISKTAAYSGSD